MYACYCVYNNELTLRESLSSVVPYVEKVVAVDGVYAQYPHKNPSSTDSTKEILHEICRNKLIWLSVKAPWPSEIAKRNWYVNHVPNGKWFLVIDGDEIIQGQVAEAFRWVEASSHNCVGIKVNNFIPIWEGLKVVHIGGHPYIVGKPIPREAWPKLKWKKYCGVGTRFYRKAEGMEYRDHHSRIHIGSTIISYAQAVAKDAALTNLNYKIGWERWQNNLEYKLNRQKIEETRLRSPSAQAKIEAQIEAWKA